MELAIIGSIAMIGNYLKNKNNFDDVRTSKNDFLIDRIVDKTNVSPHKEIEQSLSTHSWSNLQKDIQKSNYDTNCVSQRKLELLNGTNIGKSNKRKEIINTNQPIVQKNTIDLYEREREQRNHHLTKTSRYMNDEKPVESILVQPMRNDNPDSWRTIIPKTIDELRIPYKKQQTHKFEFNHGKELNEKRPMNLEFEKRKPDTFWKSSPTDNFAGGVTLKNKYESKIQEPNGQRGTYSDSIYVSPLKLINEHDDNYRDLHLESTAKETSLFDANLFVTPFNSTQGYTQDIMNRDNDIISNKVLNHSSYYGGANVRDGKMNINENNYIKTSDQTIKDTNIFPHFGNQEPTHLKHIVQSNDMKPEITSKEVLISTSKPGNIVTHSNKSTILNRQTVLPNTNKELLTNLSKNNIESSVKAPILLDRKATLHTTQKEPILQESKKFVNLITKPRLIDTSTTLDTTNREQLIVTESGKTLNMMNKQKMLDRNTTLDTTNREQLHLPQKNGQFVGRKKHQVKLVDNIRPTLKEDLQYTSILNLTGNNKSKINNTELEINEQKSSYQVDISERKYLQNKNILKPTIGIHHPLKVTLRDTEKNNIGNISGISKMDNKRLIKVDESNRSQNLLAYNGIVNSTIKKPRNTNLENTDVPLTLRGDQSTSYFANSTLNNGMNGYIIHNKLELEPTQRSTNETSYTSNISTNNASTGSYNLLKIEAKQTNRETQTHGYVSNAKNFISGRKNTDAIIELNDCNKELSKLREPTKVGSQLSISIDNTGETEVRKPHLIVPNHPMIERSSELTTGSSHLNLIGNQKFKKILQVNSYDRLTSDRIDRSQFDNQEKIEFKLQNC